MCSGATVLLLRLVSINTINLSHKLVIDEPATEVSKDFFVIYTYYHPTKLEIPQVKSVHLHTIYVFHGQFCSIR